VPIRCADNRKPPQGRPGRNRRLEIAQAHRIGIGFSHGGKQTLESPLQLQPPTPVAAQTDPGPVLLSQSASVLQSGHCATFRGAQIVRDVPVEQAQLKPQSQVGPSTQ
jgi:hypothetical protein